MRTIRASEINTFLYCQRAWWYQMNGHTPENQVELISGKEIHEQHGRIVARAGCARVIAYFLLLFALVLLTVYLTLQVYR